MWTAEECWLYVILSFKYWNYFWTSLKNHWLLNVKQQICYPYLEWGEFNNILLNCALIKGRGDQENWVNDFWLSLKKSIETMDTSIRTLPIYPIYFIQNYSFSKYYLEINSHPILIIILSRKAKRCVVYSSNFEHRLK